MNSTSKNLLKTTDIVTTLHYVNTLIIEIKAASTTQIATAAVAVAPPIISNRNSGNSNRSWTPPKNAPLKGTKPND